jgi:hypothetical protein
MAPERMRVEHYQGPSKETAEARLHFAPFSVHAWVDSDGALIVDIEHEREEYILYSLVMEAEDGGALRVYDPGSDEPTEVYPDDIDRSRMGRKGSGQPAEDPQEFPVLDELLLEWERRHAGVVPQRAWDLFETVRGWEIQRYDVLAAFADDAAALRYVQAIAARGDTEAQLALGIYFHPDNRKGASE